MERFKQGIHSLQPNIDGLIAVQAKAHATGVVPAGEILFDLPSLKLMTSSAVTHQTALVA